MAKAVLLIKSLAKAVLLITPLAKAVLLIKSLAKAVLLNKSLTIVVLLIKSLAKAVLLNKSLAIAVLLIKSLTKAVLLNESIAKAVSNLILDFAACFIHSFPRFLGFVLLVQVYLLHDSFYGRLHSSDAREPPVIRPHNTQPTETLIVLVHV